MDTWKSGVYSYRGVPIFAVEKVAEGLRDPIVAEAHSPLNAEIFCQPLPLTEEPAFEKKAKPVMKKSPATETNPTTRVTVLSVSPSRDDHTWLRQIFSKSGWAEYTHSQWSLTTRPTLESAVATLQRSTIPIVLCEADLLRGTWREMLEESRHLSDPPLLIVTSRLADEHLWAEALNLGAYDVLAKPFDENEVVRVVSFAWLHWKDHAEFSAKPARVMRAAS